MFGRIAPRRPSPALVIAVIALFAALTGSSYAEPVRSQVSALIHGKTIKKRSIGGKQVKKNAFTGFHIREGKLAKVPSAKNADTLGGQGPATFLGAGAKAADADKLDGKDSTGFAEGNVTVLAGRTVGPAGADPNPIRTFDTAAGRFELSCGAASAGTHLRNTSAANQRVARLVIFEDESGADTDEVLYDAEETTPDDTKGYAANSAAGLTRVELTGFSETGHARMTVDMQRVGLECQFDWELRDHQVGRRAAGLPSKVRRAL